jgi:GH24 family phage-related lysozyme (muramidase)
MRVSTLELVFAGLILAPSAAVASQSVPATATGTPGNEAASFAAQSSALSQPELSPPAEAASDVERLRSFEDSDVKFDLGALMEVLRDKRHEGWVLAAYPDPKTGRPLIGAGFTLDLPARAHPQTDPLNSHPFLEPSSAELWQAAGLEPDRLDLILEQYQARLEAWTRRGFRRRLANLSPQITDQEATRLLRVAAIQAIYNAKAYCRNFDAMTASQQMALSQLVYQMGVNLAEFSEFLGLINRDALAAAQNPESEREALPARDRDYWNSVQRSLIASQWARLYRTRAIAVIAMLDPEYADNPRGAELRIGAVLRPVSRHRARSRRATLNPVATSGGRRAQTLKRKVRTTSKKRV